jgi:hypothetical protein
MHESNSVYVSKDTTVRSLVVAIDVLNELTAFTLKVEEGLTLYPEDACNKFLRNRGGYLTKLISFVFQHRLRFYSHRLKKIESDSVGL